MNRPRYNWIFNRGTVASGYTIFRYVHDANGLTVGHVAMKKEKDSVS